MSEPIISRKDAKAQGLKFYFTGKPCPYGHVAQRYTANFWCLECQLASQAKPEARTAKRAYNKRYRVEHPEKVASANKKWRDSNKEKHYATQDIWRAANLDKVKTYVAKSRLKFRAKRLEAARQWRVENPGRRLEVYRAWCDKNRERIRALWNKRRARKLGAEGYFTEQDIAQLKQQQRGRCAYCRVRLGDDFHRDHIISLAKGGSNWPSNIQLLCQPCNNRKHAKDPIVFAKEIGRLL